MQIKTTMRYQITYVRMVVIKKNTTKKCWQGCAEKGTFVHSVQFSSVQSLSRVRLSATPWIVAHQASLSITNSRSLLRLMPIESVMPSSHLILCCPLLLLPPIPPSIRVFSNESTLCIRLYITGWKINWVSCCRKWYKSF